MTRSLLAVGANLGDRAAALRKTLELIAVLPGTQLLARSTWHETVPVGGPEGQASFLNGAVLVESLLAPGDFAAAMQDIERQLGRERVVRWDARTIDIDLLLYGDQIIDTAGLQIPHPRMSFRQFMLAPAAEIAGEMIHPTSGWTIAALLHQLHSRPRTVAVIADDTNIKKWLEAELTREFSTDPNLTTTVKLISYDPNVGSDVALKIFVGGAECSAGPALRITATDRTLIRQEAIAAVRAAWPD
jgi:2-amino-4-hydroxy-6-hydroxymethyldihydropteridine diphosphokinase